MPESDDIALLQQYAENGSESAFAALVERHVNLVYSVALRSVGQCARRRGNRAGGLHHSGEESGGFVQTNNSFRLALSNDAADGGELFARRKSAGKTANRRRICRRF